MQPTPPTPGPLPPGQMPPGYYPYPYPPPPKSSLLWLWILLGVLGVLVVVGILAAIAIPSFIDYSKKAKRSEATMQVERLFKQVKVHYYENADVPRISAEPTPPEGSCCLPGAGGKCAPDYAQWQAEPWRSLDFSIDERSLFSYSYQVDPSGKRFTVSAHGDLDCDGKSVVYYQIVGTLVEGTIQKEVTITRGAGD